MKCSQGVILIISCLLAGFAYGGVLQVRPSKTREVLSLDGLWYFTTNASLVSNIEEANDLEVNLMPVPSSYNDISTKLNVRDHVGAVWYKRTFFVPSSWKNKKVWIRFGSVCYNASVEINSNIAATHYIGHLPFAADVSSYLNYGDENTITVEVNNILTNDSIPQGIVETTTSGRLKQTYTFDFFNYAGIDRPVYLYTTNNAFVDDIDIKTQLNGTNGLVTYDVAISGSNSNTSIQVNILDKKGNIVASSKKSADAVTINNAKLWWPYLMNEDPGYLYNLEILLKENDILVDHYRQSFGIRELKYDNTSFTINGKNIYIRGFGRHEDSDIRGKGLDLPLIIRDHNLIKWIGANCYRTSHYPYADEIMDLADQLGIMIIDEVPAVNTENFSNSLLENHKRSWTELYKRDKNRPSVVIWSIANEPRTQYNESEDYYRQVAAHVKSFDTSRPITIAEAVSFDEDHAGEFLDILGVNRYEGWYLNPGDLDVIYENILEQARGWYKKYQKPVLFTEYGADSLEGLSFLPTYIWSEEYQNDLMVEYFKAFDELRTEGWFIGEMIWNFADFKTDQSIKRVGGNKKGLFTRNRQPKQAAFLMRKRYWSLANKLEKTPLPPDLEPYIIDSFYNNKQSKDELQVAAHVKSFDVSRPITIANAQWYDVDHSGQFLDILGVNRYEAWYHNVGELDGIKTNVMQLARAWHDLHNKPVLFTEYGADAEQGLSFLPTYIWSEEYQTAIMVEHFKAFDEMRSEGWFIGEMIWNFADFKTDQDYTRVGGNKKGMFTRNRQPKQSAFLLRQRYWALAHQLDKVSLPDDLQSYIIDNSYNKGQHEQCRSEPSVIHVK